MLKNVPKIKVAVIIKQMKEKTQSKPQTKTVLIAMTGGVESTVAAYLLKKQGYRCIGIGLQLFNTNDNPGPFADVAVTDLNKVKNICNYLDIPFYAVNAAEIFADKVLDPMVGRILSGQTFEPLVFLNTILIEIMSDKAAKFQTNLLATAHYAKVLKNQKSGAYELLVANDLEHDQSYMLSQIPQEHLANLILPLSEIRKKEVAKIGELIKVDYIVRSKENRSHIMHDPRMIDLVEERSPLDLRRTGSIFDYSTESSICEHDGIHRFYIGQKNLPGKGEIEIDPLKEVIMITPFKGNIFVDYPNKLNYKQALVVQMIISLHLDVSKPISAFVKMSPKGDKIPCRLYFKNNETCLVDFEESRPGLLVAGQLVVFYNRQNEKGKVIASGLIEAGGNFDANGYNTLPEIKEDGDEEEEAPKENELMRF